MEKGSEAFRGIVMSTSEEDPFSTCMSRKALFLGTHMEETKDMDTAEVMNGMK